MTKLLIENINRVWSTLIIDEFLKNKITHFYLSPGMRNAPLIAALSHLQNFHPEIKIIMCMDERAGAYRALGYAKATGIPSVLLCTSGTAMANYMPAVIEAKKSNLPLIILSADRPPELTFCDDNQTMDQTKFYGSFVQGEMSLGAPSIEISPLALTSSLSNLIHKSLFPQKGPVHFNCAFREPLEATLKPLPADYIKLAVDLMERVGPSTRYMSTSSIPDDLDLTEIANTLSSTRNGLLVVGSLNPYDDTHEVEKFIGLLKWPVYFDVSSSLKYQFNLTDNALPTIDHPEVQDALIKNPPETVLHIGGRLTSKHYYSFLKQVPSINLITLSRNIEKEDPSHHTKIRINADINSTLSALSQKLFVHSKNNKIQNEVKRELDFEAFTKKKIKLIDDGPLSYPLISKSIVDNIKEGSILYIGNSTVVRSFDAYFSYQTRKKLTIATNRGVSGIEGFIASSAGFMDGKEIELYLIIGDVSFIHDLNSLYFLKDLKFPLKIILINNDGGGIFTLLPIHQEKNVINYITSPHGQSFKAAADLAGIEYRSVKEASQLKSSLNEVQQCSQNILLEIFIDNKTNKAVYDELRTIKL
jgi:2-succinyl-5-enolpyruvyl-6-hydroxy-3-cyclohexene-1-carboxylate synthase